MPVPRLVLASASPARRATLLSAGVDPVVTVSQVDEAAVVRRYEVSDAEDVALVLAKAKAEDVVTRLDQSVLDQGALILGCDSVLALDGEVHGKPADADEALARWKRLSGGRGVLHTGHWIIDARADGSGGTVGAVASTTVHFADLSDDEIGAYVASGEPLAAAGAFTVDGLGGAFIKGIEGDHHNVVGVSLPLMRTLLRDLGVRWHELWQH
jgi:septum formation protein